MDFTVQAKILGLKDGDITKVEIEGKKYTLTPEGKIPTVEFDKPKVETNKETKKKKKTKSGSRRSKTLRPHDAVVRDDTYKVWITKDYIKRVKQSIHRTGYGYKPTIDNIIEVTKLTRNKVLGTLHYLIEEGEIERRFENKQYLYRMVEK